MDRLGLHIFLNTLRTTLTSNTALLEPTKWCLRRGVEGGVDADGTCFDLAGDSQSTGDIGGVYGCCGNLCQQMIIMMGCEMLTAKTVCSVVCQFDSLILILECPHRNHWTEDLISVDLAL